MNIFVTGATGVLGRSCVHLLLHAGHHVRGLARSAANLVTIQELGGEPIEGDLFDPVSVHRAMPGCEAVLHLATKIPPLNKMKQPDAWAENDRIRRDGTRNLVDAALANRATTLLYPSICLAYGDSAANWIEAPTATVRPSKLTESTLAAEAEVQRFSAAGNRGIVLRMGTFYGRQPSQTILDLAKYGMAAAFGGADTYRSSIWIDDAASAVVAALAKAPADTFDIVDDEPLTNQDTIEAMAAAAGKRTLSRLPQFALRWTVGSELMEVLSRSQRVSSRRFKDATGWIPQVPSARLGWRLITGRSPG